MKNYIITRHPATVTMVKKKMGIEDAIVLPHLDDEEIAKIGAGDRVFGILPLHLIYRLILKGVRYYAIVLPDVPLERRGQELTEAELKEYGFRILKVDELYLQEVLQEVEDEGDPE